MTRVYVEWGIVRRSSPDRLHAGPFAFAEAMTWLVGWEEDGGDPREYRLVRRRVGEWVPAMTADRWAVVEYASRTR